MDKRIFSKEKIVCMPDKTDQNVFGVGHKKNKIKVDKNYKYKKNLFIRFCQFIIYYILGRPIFYLYGKLFLGVKVYGKDKIKNIKTGAVTISNHVHMMDFSIATNFIVRTTRSHVISLKDNFDIPVAGKLLSAYGVLPLPETPQAKINFYKLINEYLNKGRYIHIYPEASLWPYYNKLRPFKPGAFHFAVKNNVPVIPYLLSFRKSKGKKRRPKISIYICDPIYPDQNLKHKEQMQDLLQKSTKEMQDMLKEHPSVEYYKYIEEEQFKQQYPQLYEKVE